MRHFSFCLLPLFLMVVRLFPSREAISVGIEERDFAASFVHCYDMVPEGRYMHEYHTFIRRQTGESLKKLENYLRGVGVELDSRMVVAGYQEDAIPPYIPDVTKEMVNDEQFIAADNQAVVASPPRNIFGLMTGFLLKDCDWIWDRVGGSEGKVFLHIGQERVEIFDDSWLLLQKHAFGLDYQFVLNYLQLTEKALVERDCSSVLERILEFWQAIYAGELKNHYGELVATQDIVFSSDYMKHLLQSPVPLTKFFTGPDITYPIEVLGFQPVGATDGAQRFLAEFERELTKHNDESTVYVFCSFVDGVGKSTTLGNLINFKNYGYKYEQYERVDNSSSQLPTLYELKEGVFILDLPAQVSHYSNKPDGFVYVDADTVRDVSADTIDRLTSYVLQNSTELESRFLSVLAMAAPSGVALRDQFVEDDAPLYYAQNLKLLFPKLQETQIEWVPFSFEGRQFMFKKSNPSHIRVLSRLAGVHSKGLKVAEPEQMIFTDLSVPMAFDRFLENIGEAIKTKKIKRAVMVDFMGMYPRSSRENVRVNFMIQLLNIIYGDRIDLSKGPYVAAVNGGRTFYSVLENYTEEVISSVAAETCLRWALYELFAAQAAEGVLAFSIPSVLGVLAPILEKIEGEYLDYVNGLAREKVDGALKFFGELYRLDKEYEIYEKFDVNKIEQFSDFLRSLFCQVAGNSTVAWSANIVSQELTETEGKEMRYYSPPLTDYYGEPAAPDNGDNGGGMGGQGSHREVPFIVTAEGEKVEVVAKIPAGALDNATKDLITMLLKANWAALITNLLLAKPSHDGEIVLETERCKVIPLFLRRNKENELLIVRPLLQAIPESRETWWDDMGIYYLFPFFGVLDGLPMAAMGRLDGSLYLIDYSSSITRGGLYEYGLNPSDGLLRNFVERFKGEARSTGFGSVLVPISFILGEIEETNSWSKVMDQIGRRGYRHQSSKKVALHRDLLRLYVRLFATLQMILRHHDTEIIVRDGNQEDFVAALKLTEKLTLGGQFGINTEQDLFDNYEEVEPIIDMVWE